MRSRVPKISHWALAKWHSLSVRTNVFAAARREPPGEYPSDLPTVTGQLALFRYKVSAQRLILKLDVDKALGWKTGNGAIGSAGATRIKVKAISIQRF